MSDIRETEALRDVVAGLEEEIRRLEQATHRAEEAEELFRSFFDDAPIGKCMTAPDGRLLRVNSAFGDILGYSLEEIQQISFVAITHPDDLAESQECVRCLLARERDTWTMDKRYIAKDGHAVWCRVSTRLQRDARGEPLHFLTHIQDISDQKQLETELRIKNQVFDDSLASQSIANREGVITHVNEAFVKMWGYPSSEVAIGQSVASFFEDPEDAGHVLEALVNHDAWQGEFAARRHDGSRFVSRGFASALRDDGGELAGYQSTNLDVTREREHEAHLEEMTAALKRSNEELEQFAYIASHDLQEPLRMVASYTQLLARRYADRLDDEAREFIDYAVDGANRMQRLISDLLTFSRVTTRGEALECIAALDGLGEALRNLEACVQETGAMVTHDELPRVRADRTQLVMLFQNLIGNAIKFHEPGATPQVHVSVEQDGAMWTFAVRDNGIGIADEFRERVFVIFQRLHGRGEYPGTGIGLALCKRIVERHGGNLWFESEPGIGTTFFFTLPDATADETAR